MNEIASIIDGSVYLEEDIEKFEGATNIFQNFFLLEKDVV